MAAPQYLSCMEGEDLALAITMDAPPAGGVSGWTILFTLADGETSVLTVGLGTGATITDAVAGAWTVAFHVPRLAAPMVPKEYQWDYWRTNTGSETSLAHGTLTVSPRARA